MPWGSPWFSGPVASLFMLNCHSCCLDTQGEGEVCGSLPAWGPDRWVHIMKLRAHWLKSRRAPHHFSFPGYDLDKVPHQSAFSWGVFLGSQDVPSHLSNSPLQCLSPSYCAFLCTPSLSRASRSSGQMVFECSV